ncbi:hypothetical protein D1007_02715 [Hordeum vulgare]|uniref:Uncharacterized protein n=2 Tax=Hordeum vulgare subsp. vulgare TaxID=112509 RepID=A0A8I6XER3_HORVV|nr:uncharacterized protein LOC123440064 [Hordeum vulgare subsp. vulgare]KAE8819483.1 hypothetical protein D1007_02715 [Hordeum vulgare]
MEDRDHGPAENLPESPDHIADGDEDGGGFTFPVLPFAADALIVPVYPIFGRPPSPPPPASVEEPETATVRVPLGRLLLEERDFRARQRDEESFGDGELEGVAPESYCLWAPGQSTPASPRRCRKSGSTGSVLRWRRISERLVGRSHSDGKDKFVFLNASPAPPNQGGVEEGGSRSDGGAGADAHGWSYYSKGGGGSGGAGRRRSYLPYKQELVGLFANVSGLRRSYPPF